MKLKIGQLFNHTHNRYLTKYVCIGYKDTMAIMKNLNSGNQFVTLSFDFYTKVKCERGKR